MNLYVLWVTQIFSMVGFNIAVPFIAYYLNDMGLTDNSTLTYYVGLSSTLPAFSMIFAAPVWGALSDKYGRKMMILRAMICAAILLTACGFTKSPNFFLVLRFLQGIFTGTITASMAFVSANTPSNRLSYALGFMTSSNFLGYAIGPVLGGFVSELIGYNGCFIAGGCIMVVGFVLVLILVKEDPNSYGAALVKSKSAKPKLVNKFIINVLILLFAARMARIIFAPYVAMFVKDVLGTMDGASRYTGFINAASGVATAIAAVTLTRLGDRHNKIRLVFIFALIAMGLSFLLLPKWNLTVFALIYGAYFFMAGAIEPLLTSAASEATDAASRGQLFGFTGSINSISMMVAPMIGAQVSNSFNTRAILYLIPAFCFVQLVVLIFVQKGMHPVGWRKKHRN